MRVGTVLLAGLGVTICNAGCAWHKHMHSAAEPAKVTVRFFAPSEEESFAAAHCEGRMRLVSNNPSQPCGGGIEPADSDTQHVVLWGGEFNGANVTEGAAELAPGPYMFTFFDPDNGAAYQGWIAVNSGGDDLASAMVDWRDTIHAEQEWLAFESKLDGKFSSHNPNDFRDFNKELRTLKSLEAKLNNAAHNEAREQQQRAQEQVGILNGAQVLLMPGEPSVFTPCTGPAFNQEELSLARSGEAVTKVVLAGDYTRTMEKLRRVSQMQGDLKRCRAVLGEQARRCENRSRYYRLTDHIYNHGDRFVENERRLQQAHGHIERLDQQLAENARRENALLFVAGLFDADEAFKAFDAQQAAMQRDRIVLEAQKRRLDCMFDSLDEMSEQRISVERQRQSLVAELEQVGAQQRETEQSRWAMAQLRKSTNVIHRQGPACVLAASFVAGGLPARVVDAISRESLMTVRLQAAGDGFPHSGSVTSHMEENSTEIDEFRLISHSND